MSGKERRIVGASAGWKRLHQSFLLSCFFRWRLLCFFSPKAGWFLLPFGFVAITAGLYSALQKVGNDDTLPTVTIFAAPRSFSYYGGLPDLAGGRQEVAVRSWLALAPEVSVVLFGKDSSVFDLARILGPRVTVDSEIDFT
ncbi:uncharacterized protein LOC110035480 [Phalaenopsis equestris]|uniref:uncharacterized protein LOC110035480 n=1 Tax=Phalaenopsis equestris TaxID=78828 RepID=UPI0009E62886|nr:uncharacterized protein LOC110035480 [Phalaenopsis equestris]